MCRLAQLIEHPAHGEFVRRAIVIALRCPHLPDTARLLREALLDETITIPTGPIRASRKKSIFGYCQVLTTDEFTDKLDEYHKEQRRRRAVPSALMCPKERRRNQLPPAERPHVEQHQ